MASARTYTMASKYRFLTPDPVTRPVNSYTELEFDESDIWGGSTQQNSAELRPSPRQQPRKKPITPARKCMAASMPVNIPDWSKILREEYKDKCSAANFGGDDGGDDGGDEDEWVAPHEYLARTRNASFSVQEGVGRTLKGRDLSRVRNAIFEKTGFQD